MSLRTSFESSRWLRAALLLVPLAMGLALVAGAWSNRDRTYEASQLLIQGQADWFLRSVGQSLRGAEGGPQQEQLDEVLEELSDDGLRHVALFGRRGAPLLQAGHALGVDEPAALDAIQVVRIDRRVRVTASFPSRRLQRPRRDSPRLEPQRLPARLAIEFEPLVADRLRKDADRAFALSAITALVLMLIASALWWQFRRSERQAASREREKRLAELGEMSAVLAHEMRNPLASLKGHAQLLLERLPTGGREAKKAERIVSEASRLETLSATLLDFVRSGTIERVPSDVETLVRRAVDEVGAKNVDIVTRGGVARKVELDPLRMGQVLVNLLENAVQVSDGDARVEVDFEVTNRSLRLRVRDRGPGLPPGGSEKIFEAFHTSKTRGTGLGLAIARRIVELHGGTLTAENHADGGAVFQVELPG